MAHTFLNGFFFNGFTETVTPIIHCYFCHGGYAVATNAMFPTQPQIPTIWLFKYPGCTESKIFGSFILRSTVPNTVNWLKGLKNFEAWLQPFFTRGMLQQDTASSLHCPQSLRGPK